MTARDRGAAAPPSQVLVIFGASGDLTARKILPALYGLHAQGMLPEGFAIVGYARTEQTDEEFRAHAREAIARHGRVKPEDDATWKSFEGMLSYVAGGFEEEGAMDHLRAHLDHADATHETGGKRLFYCATPPSAFAVIVRRIAESDLGRDAGIVIEKPFGRDLRSARALTRDIHGVFDESRVFRIDHYLGKETVQNILVFRFANSMYERVWNRDAIDHVEITVAEAVGIEGRGRFYEETGAIRDIVQNHLLQVLAFVAMEPPRSMDAPAIHDEKVKLLRALQPFTEDDTIRGQYDSYRNEDGVARSSTVETYVAMRAEVENWRWDGVPFYLRTGKHLSQRVTEVAVVFREPPGYLFEERRPEADHLTIRIQPDEGMSFAFQAKDPGPGFTPRTVRMDFGYAEHFGAEPADAYERLLHDALCGDTTLFTREDAVERAWEIVAPLLHGSPKVYRYPEGSWGPREADALIAPKHWHLR